jgi:hypothetical protein
MKRKMKKYNGEDGSVVGPRVGGYGRFTDENLDDEPKNTRLPSAKESTGTQVNTEYKEEKKSKPAKKPETSQKFPLREPEYKDTKAKIGNQSFPVEEPKYRGTVKSKDMGSQKFPVEGPKYRGTVSAKELGSQTFSKGGSTASRRADGCAMRGKTRGKIV